MLKPATLPSALAMFLAAPLCVGVFAEETVPEGGKNAESRILLPKKSSDERSAEVIDSGDLLPPPKRIDRTVERPAQRAINPKTERPEELPVDPVTADAPAPRLPASDKPTRDDDLIGDRKPVGSAVATVTPTTVQELLEEMPPPSPISTKARQCYRLLGELKSNAEKINTGLDDGGKEVTLLVRLSDDLSTNVTDLSDLWPEEKLFIDHCTLAKRQTLILNEELSRVPRNWRYLRRAMNSSLIHISKLRHVARELADAEPKPVAVKGKDGKMVYVDAEPAPLPPELARREEAVSEAKRVRELQRKQEEEREKKRKQIPVDLDGTRK